MTQRKYSVAEIDAMRAAIGNSIRRPVDERVIEERLRTHMLNGTEPEELQRAADDFFDKEMARLRDGK